MFLRKKDRPRRGGEGLTRSLFVFLFLFLKEARRGGKDALWPPALAPRRRLSDYGLRQNQKHPNLESMTSLGGKDIIRDQSA